MTTPAPDAPLVFPSLAFRPARLLVVCVVLGAVVVLAAAYFGAPMVGVFFTIGLLMGLLNAIAVKRAALRITAQEHPLKSQMAINSSVRVGILTLVALAIAFVFRPQGLGVVFGLALFQLLLVLTTSLPVLKAMRSGPAAATEGSARGDV